MSALESGNDAPPKVATILLTLRIENNSKFVRGKKRTIEHVESFYPRPIRRHATAERRI